MSEHSNRGRQRLRLLLSALNGSLCALAMATVLVLYGTPYDSLWWWVMGAVLAAAFLVAPLFVFPIEWVIKGYLERKPDRLGLLGLLRPHGTGPAPNRYAGSARPRPEAGWPGPS